MDGVGRFYPLGWLVSYHFYGLFQELWVSRVAHMAFVVANALFCGRVVWRWSGSRARTLWFVVVLVGLFQLRDFFDPIGTYAPFLQVIFFCLLGATYFQVRFLERGGVGYLALSLGLFCCGLLSYEISLTFLPVFFVLPLIWRESGRSAK